MDIVLTAETNLDHTIHPTSVMVVGTRYKVDYGPQVRPRVHIVNKQRQCACELGAICPAIRAVEEYLQNGGQRAPDPMPQCSICGGKTVRDRDWDGKYTKELGWRCVEGGRTHFLQAKAQRIQAANRDKLVKAGC